jgi:hypothetical protein
VTARAPARERDIWYRNAIRNCASTHVVKDRLGDENWDRNAGFRDPLLKQTLYKANLRLYHYFLAAVECETDPGCAWTLNIAALRLYYLDPKRKTNKYGLHVYTDDEKLSYWKIKHPIVWDNENDVYKRERRFAERFRNARGKLGEACAEMLAEVARQVALRGEDFPEDAKFLDDLPARPDSPPADPPRLSDIVRDEARPDTSMDTWYKLLLDCMKKPLSRHGTTKADQRKVICEIIRELESKGVAPVEIREILRYDPHGLKIEYPGNGFLKTEGGGK